MFRRISASTLCWPAVFVFLLVAAGCQINNYDADPAFELRENFLYTRSIAERTELYISNINGTVTVTGVDTLTDVRISGTKIVKDQSEGAAERHMGDISIEMQETLRALNIETHQPSTSGGRSYQVNYEVLVPASWKVVVNNVNGNVDMQNIHNAVTASVVNGIVNATDIAGSTAIAVTNGSINGKVYLPEDGSCSLTLVNGNVSLLVPRSLSASVSASVTLGSVAVSNLPMTYTSNSWLSVTGVVGGGKGNVRLSSVNGVVQLIGM